MGLAYEIELRDASDTVVYAPTVGETADIGSHIVPFDLDLDKAYYWQIRGVANTATGLSTGPWSITGGFRTPKPTAQNAPAPGGPRTAPSARRARSRSTKPGTSS